MPEDNKPQEGHKKNDSTLDPNNWDLTNEPSPPDSLENPSLKDIDVKREEKRGQIALYLIYILAFIVFLSLIRAYMYSDAGDFKQILEILFSPIVGLVGTATGFYFGEKISKG